MQARTISKEKGDWVYGLDGCKKGWVCVGLSIPLGLWKVFYIQNITELWIKHKETTNENLVFIDIPIGLPNSKQPLRKCDILARRMLGKPQAHSLFPVPARPVLYCKTYEEANKVNRSILRKGLSKQTWNIVPKIREIDTFLLHSPFNIRKELRESHPEVAFYGLNNERPIRFSKKTPEGKRIRLKLINETGFFLDFFSSPYQIKEFIRKKRLNSILIVDDILDAAALASIAAIHNYPFLREKWKPKTIPEESIYDEEGLPQEISYATKIH